MMICNYRKNSKEIIYSKNINNNYKNNNMTNYNKSKSNNKDNKYNCNNSNNHPLPTSAHPLAR